MTPAEFLCVSIKAEVLMEGSLAFIPQHQAEKSGEQLRMFQKILQKSLGSEVSTAGPGFVLWLGFFFCVFLGVFLWFCSTALAKGDL